MVQELMALQKVQARQEAAAGSTPTGGTPESSAASSHQASEPIPSLVEGGPSQVPNQGTAEDHDPSSWVSLHEMQRSKSSRNQTLKLASLTESREKDSELPDNEMMVGGWVVIICLLQTLR